MNFGKALIKIQNNCLESYSRWNFLIFSLDLELVPKKPTSNSFRSEASTYGLTCSGDRDNHRTCYRTVHCFSLKMWRTCGNTQEFFVCSLSRLSHVVNRNGRKDGGQH